MAMEDETGKTREQRARRPRFACASKQSRDVNVKHDVERNILIKESESGDGRAAPGLGLISDAHQAQAVAVARASWSSLCEFALRDVTGTFQNIARSQVHGQDDAPRAP